MNKEFSEKLKKCFGRSSTGTKGPYSGEDLPDIPLKDYRYMDIEWSYNKLEDYVGKLTLEEVLDKISKNELPELDPSFQNNYGSEIKNGTKYETYIASVMEDVEEGTWHSATVLLPESIVNFYDNRKSAEDDAKKVVDSLNDKDDWYIGTYLSTILKNLPNKIGSLDYREVGKLRSYFRPAGEDK